MKKNLPRSIRKFIRKEKARIKSQSLSLKEQNEKIKNLYKKLFLKIKTNKPKI